MVTGGEIGRSACPTMLIAAAALRQDSRCKRKSGMQPLEGAAVADYPWMTIFRVLSALVVLTSLAWSTFFGGQVDLDHALMIFFVWFLARQLFLRPRKTACPALATD